jgi:hypothetical protein
MNDALKIKTVKKFIADQGSKFVSIEFLKKNGDPRKMIFNPYGTRKHLKGDKASASSQQAVATRRTNNPHLFNIFEHNLDTGETETKMRCFNILSLTRIKCGGMEINFKN